MKSQDAHQCLAQRLSTGSISPSTLIRADPVSDSLTWALTVASDGSKIRQTGTFAGTLDAHETEQTISTIDFNGSHLFEYDTPKHLKALGKIAMHEHIIFI